MLTNYSHIVLDACCVLNFCASDRLIGILKSIPAQVVVTETVRVQELLTLERVEENVEGNRFEDAIRLGLIAIEDFESESEENAFVNYAFELGDDGESATFAIAASRGWAVATDDKKAISFFKREFPQLVLLSSLDIIKNYSIEANLPPSELKALLQSVRLKGRYVPSKRHPLRAWWNENT